MSLIEYVSHRWVMHRRLWFIDRLYPQFYFDHNEQHHKRFYRKFDYEPSEEGRDFNIDPPYWWLTLIVLFPIIIFLYLINIIFSITFISVVLIHNLSWSIFHRQMHQPRDSWLRRTRYFVFLNRWHEKHHKHMNRNFAALLPFWDFIFRTNI